jgi:hypothetical protein
VWLNQPFLNSCDSKGRKPNGLWTNSSFRSLDTTAASKHFTVESWIHGLAWERITFVNGPSPIRRVMDEPDSVILVILERMQLARLLTDGWFQCRQFTMRLVICWIWRSFSLMSPTHFIQNNWIWNYDDQWSELAPRMVSERHCSDSQNECPTRLQTMTPIENQDASQQSGDHNHVVHRLSQISEFTGFHYLLSILRFDSLHMSLAPRTGIRVPICQDKEVTIWYWCRHILSLLGQYSVAPSLKVSSQVRIRWEGPSGIPLSEAGLVKIIWSLGLMQSDSLIH